MRLLQACLVKRILMGNSYEDGQLAKSIAMEASQLLLVSRWGDGVGHRM
jgi:hypothetical protein